MMDTLGQIAESVEGIRLEIAAAGARAVARATAERLADERRHARAVARLEPHAVNPTWPWTAATLAQGFLSSRWLRRDGTGYMNSVTSKEGRNAESQIHGTDNRTG